MRSADMSAFTEAAGASLGAAVGSKLLGSGASGSKVKRHLRWENRYFFRRERELYHRAVDRGLTPQEYYGSPAPGVSGPSGSMAATLGNAENQAAIAGSEIAAQAFGKSQDRAVLKRGQDTQLAVAKLQAGAQIESAKIGAGATKEAATITQTGQVAIARLRNLLEERKISLAEKEFDKVTLPAAEANIGLTREQIKVAVNQIATTTPEFIRGNILLQMGFDNTMQNMILKRHDVDPTSVKSMQSLSSEEFESLMTLMLGYSSAIGRETRGIASTANDLVSYILGLVKGFSPDQSSRLGPYQERYRR